MKFDYLYGTHGLEEASEYYYKKPLEELDSEELKTLIKMFKNPVIYNPLREKLI